MGIGRFVVVLLLIAVPMVAAADSDMVYTTSGPVNLRQGPSTAGAVVRRLWQNQTLRRKREENGWSRVCTLSGQTGWVRSDLVSDTWIKVHKKERTLTLMRGDMAVRSWKMALCPFNPLEDKMHQGDGGTPEGRFFVCEALREPGAAKYGARSMRLSYPSVEDARRGLVEGVVTRTQYKAILLAVRQGRMPLQNTGLGGSIRIHGGGAGADWTLGCIGMEDADIRELFELVPPRVRVEVWRSRVREKLASLPGWPLPLVAAGARAQLKSPAEYTLKAMGYQRLDYPLGDIAPDEGVCTDVVIRAARNANLDLQALLHEDFLLAPEAYAEYRAEPDPHIDHRRVVALDIFLSRNAVAPDGGDPWLGGEIVLMDTGIDNGTPLDHAGVVGGEPDGRGIPGVVNNWAPGASVRSMALLEQVYPTVVARYRLPDPLEFH